MAGFHHRGKLPLWATVGKAYRAAHHYLPALMRITWLWLAITTPVYFLAIWVLWPWLFSARWVKSLASGSIDDWLRALSADFALIAILLPFVSSVAVAWHRLLLRDERVAAFAYLRLDKIVWVYLLVALAIAVAQHTTTEYLPIVTFYSLEGTMFPVAAWNILILAASVAVMLVAVRVSVLLPVVALDVHGIALGDIWRRTQGNTWRLFVGFAVCLIPMVIAALLFSLLWQEQLSLVDDDARIVGRLPNALAFSLSAVPLQIFLVVPIGFLSFAYQHFFEASAAARAPTQSK